MKFILFFVLFLSCDVSFSDFSYRDSRRFTTGNPELLDLSRARENALNNYKVIDLSASVDIGSSCGTIDVASNLRANLRQFMNGDFYKGLGNQIMDAGGLLALCYLSPAACSITKNTRLSSGLTSSLDLSACQSIEKFQSQQIAVYERERSQCVRSELKRNGNNVNAALNSCGNKNYEYELTDWAGGKKNVNLNKLIESTAKWAGLKGEDAKDTIELTKAFVGDTVIGKGGVEVEFGSRKRIVSPGELIEDDKKVLAEKLEKLFHQYDNQWSLSDKEIKKVFDKKIPHSVAKSLVERLSYMPAHQRSMAIQKLSSVIATQEGIEKVEKSMELLQLASRNPNVPDAQKTEANQLREQLKTSLDLNLTARKRQENRLEKVVKSISEEGEKYENWNNQETISVEKTKFESQALREEFLDCSDQVFCEEVSIVLD